MYFHGASSPFGASAPRTKLKPKTAAPRPEPRVKVKVPAKASPGPAKSKRKLPLASPSVTLSDPRACLRSPCGIPDPKVSEAKIEAARALVGTPKLQRKVDVEDGKVVYRPTRGVHRPGVDSWPLTVAYGLGLDSTAILVGLVQLYRETGDPKWVPKAITFGDTGGEQDHTYEFLKKINAYLTRHGFPKVTVVAWTTEMRGGEKRASWGTARTLEQNALNNHTLPDISITGHSNCSNKFKQGPQREWLRKNVPLRQGQRMLRAIGYDATEDRRLLKGSTYDASNEEKYGFFAWYPLLEWGWDRARCYAEVERELGQVPRKSSCFFCGAMRPEEIAALPKHLLKRAVFMEQVAFMGRHGLGTTRRSGEKGGVRGLGRSFSWTDFATGNVSKLQPIQRVVLEGGVVDHSGKRGVVYLGAGPERATTDNHLYFRGLSRPLLTQAEVDQIKALAKAWASASPRSGGDKSRDVSQHPVARKIDAFRDVRGFRGTKHMTWDRHQVLVEAGRVLANPGADAPADHGQIPRDPLLFGTTEGQLVPNGPRRNPLLPAAGSPYFLPGKPSEAFVPEVMPRGAPVRPPMGLQFNALATGGAPLVFKPEGVQERPRVNEALYNLLQGQVQYGQGLISPDAWEDLLASAGTVAKVYVVDRRGERYELREVLFDHGGETGRLVLRHLGARSREGDLVIDIRQAYGYMLPVVVYKDYP